MEVIPELVQQGFEVGRVQKNGPLCCISMRRMCGDAGNAVDLVDGLPFGRLLSAALVTVALVVVVLLLPRLGLVNRPRQAM